MCGKSDPGGEGQKRHVIKPSPGQEDDDMPTGLWHQPVTGPHIREGMPCQTRFSERGEVFKGKLNSKTNLFLVIWYQGVWPHQIMATHFLKPENKYLTQKTSLKLINSKCLEDGLVFTFQGFPFQSKHMCGAYCDVCEWLREAFKYPYWRNCSFKTE